MGARAGRIEGNEALAEYWRRGLEALPELHFDLHTAFVGSESVVLGYRNERLIECAEEIALDDDGLAYFGRAHYGPEPEDGWITQMAGA